MGSQTRKQTSHYPLTLVGWVLLVLRSFLLLLRFFPFAFPSCTSDFAPPPPAGLSAEYRGMDGVGWVTLCGWGGWGIVSATTIIRHPPNPSNRRDQLGDHF